MTLKPNTSPEPTGSIVESNGTAAKGIRSAEAEHHHILGLLEKATLAFARHSAASEINAILLELNGYSLNHFREEEKLMDSSAFPGVEMHKREHAQLASQIRGLLDTTSKQEALQHAVSVLALWLDAHLRIADKDFLEFMRSKAK
jgi:hemerythrin-like metal-binding protein